MTGLAAFLVVLLTMQIEGTGDCPPVAEVEAKLAPLLPPELSSSSVDRAMIAESTDGSLWISLARPDGTMVASRRLPRARTCAEQAETAAVALAVWEAQIHPEISLRLDRLASAPTSAAEPAPPPPKATAPQLVAARTRAPGATPAAVLAPALGAAALGSWQLGSVAPGARIDATLGTAEARWRARLSLTGVGWHAAALSPGEARWWRLYTALGADYGLPLGRRWQVTLGVAGVLGALNAEGAGFSIDRATRSVDLGAEAVLCAEARLGSVRPWLGVGILAWLRQQIIEVTGDARSTVLPRFEPLFLLGVDFCPRC
jgi:hypothetical protein